MNAWQPKSAHGWHGGVLFTREGAQLLGFKPRIRLSNGQWRVWSYAATPHREVIAAGRFCTRRNRAEGRGPV